MLTNFKELTQGSILSENTCYTVISITGDFAECMTNTGQVVTLGRPYVEQLLHAADQYTSEEKKTKTELAAIAISWSRIACTVAFYKQDVDKTKKKFNEEKQAKIDEIRNAKVSDVESLLSDLIDNPILPYVKGDLRIMKGIHYGEIDDLGRIKFTDMEVTQGSNLRQLDPRTIEYIIVNNVKYTLKK